jgi:DNA-directed RNA polymerase subunit RPC12/RpoP
MTKKISGISCKSALSPQSPKFYKCNKCGSSFAVKKGLWDLFVKPRCPKCGSRDVTEDKMTLG